MLLQQRILFCDKRFVAVYDRTAPRFKSTQGGNAVGQSHAQDELERQILKELYGPWIAFVPGKRSNTIVPKLMARRRQKF